MQSSFVKVMGILMVIFGALGLIVGLLTYLTYGSLESLLGLTLPATGTLIGIIEAAAMLIFGIMGIINSKKPAKAGVCIITAIILIALAVVAIIVSSIEVQGLLSQISDLASSFGVDISSYGSVSWTNFTGLIIPGLFLVASILFKKNNA